MSRLNMDPTSNWQPIECLIKNKYNKPTTSILYSKSWLQRRKLPVHTAPTFNYAGVGRPSLCGVCSVTSPGERMAGSTVWLALNERMWVTMSLSLGTTTAWGDARSWIWNNERVNGLHHHYWFSFASHYALCPLSSPSLVAVFPLREATPWDL